MEQKTHQLSDQQSNITQGQVIGTQNRNTTAPNKKIRHATNLLGLDFPSDDSIPSYDEQPLQIVIQQDPTLQDQTSQYQKDLASLTTVEKRVLHQARLVGAQTQIQIQGTSHTYFSYDIGGKVQIFMTQQQVKQMQDQYKVKMSDYIPHTTFTAFAANITKPITFNKTMFTNTMTIYHTLLQNTGLQTAAQNILTNRVHLTRHPIIYVLSGSAAIKVIDGTKLIGSLQLIKPTIYTQYSNSDPDYQLINQIQRMVSCQPLQYQITLGPQLAADIELVSQRSLSNRDFLSQVARLDKIAKVIQLVQQTSQLFWDTVTINNTNNYMVQALANMGLFIKEGQIVSVQNPTIKMISDIQTMDLQHFTHNYARSMTFTTPFNIIALQNIGQDYLKTQLQMNGKFQPDKQVYEIDQQLYINGRAGAGPSFKSHKQIEVVVPILKLATLYNFINYPQQFYTQEMRTFATQNGEWFNDKMSLQPDLKVHLQASARVSYLKAKKEVLDKAKPVRNINSVNIAAFYPSANYFDQVLKNWSPYPTTKQLLNYKIFHGGFHKLFNHIVNTKHDAFVYSDNIYYYNGYDYFSLDVSSMECSHTQSTVRLNLANLIQETLDEKVKVDVRAMENGTSPQHLKVSLDQQLTSPLTNYLLDTFSTSCVDMVGVVGSVQLQTLGLGSGVFGTHIVNTLTTLSTLWVLNQSIPFDSFYDFNSQTLRDEFVQIFSAIGGIAVKAEVADRGFGDRFNKAIDQQEDVFFKVDLLGYDGVMATYGGVRRFIPVLQLQRLQAAMYFKKFDNTVSKIVQQACTKEQMAAFTATQKDQLYQITGNLIKLLKARQLFIIGGWYHRPQQLLYQCQAALVGLTTTRGQISDLDQIMPEVICKLAQVAQQEVNHDMQQDDKVRIDYSDPTISMPAMVDVLTVCSDSLQVQALIQNTMERYGNKELAVSDLLFLLGPKNMPKELVDIVQETMITKLLDIDNYIKDQDKDYLGLQKYQEDKLMDAYKPRQWTLMDQKLQKIYEDKLKNQLMKEESQRIQLVNKPVRSNQETSRSIVNLSKKMTNQVIKISNIEIVNGCVRDIQYVFNAIHDILNKSNVLSRDFVLFSNQAFAALTQIVANLNSKKEFVDTILSYTHDFIHDVQLAITKVFAKTDSTLVSMLYRAQGGSEGQPMEIQRDTIMNSELVVRIILGTQQDTLKQIIKKGSIKKLVQAVNASNLVASIQSAVANVFSTLRPDRKPQNPLVKITLPVGYLLVKFTRPTEVVIPYVDVASVDVPLSQTLVLPTTDSFLNGLCFAYKLRFMVETYYKKPPDHWNFTHTFATTNTGLKAPVSTATIYPYLLRQGGIPPDILEGGFTPINHADFVGLQPILANIILDVVLEPQIVDVVVSLDDGVMTNTINPGPLTIANIHQWFLYTTQKGLQMGRAVLENQLNQMLMDDRVLYHQKMRRYMANYVPWTTRGERIHAILSNKFIDNSAQVVQTLLFKQPLSYLFSYEKFSSADIDEGHQFLASILLVRKMKALDPQNHYQFPTPTMQVLSDTTYHMGTYLYQTMKKEKQQWALMVDDDEDQEDYYQEAHEDWS